MRPEAQAELIGHGFPFPDREPLVHPAGLLNFEALKAEQDGADVIAAVFDFVTAFPAVIRAGFWCLLRFDWRLKLLRPHPGKTNLF